MAKNRNNRVVRETSATITAAIDRALKTERALSSAEVERFASWADNTDALVARMAYVVRLRGIGDQDGVTSLQTFADRIGRKRPSMSQYASMIGWLVESHTPVTGETFGYARTLYGRGKTVKPRVDAALADVAALDTDEKRVAAWKNMHATFVVAKPTDDNGAGEGDDPNNGAGEGEGEGREPRVNVPTPTMTRVEWIETLDALATSAVLLSDASDAERAHIVDTLAEISARIVAPATVDAE